MGFYSNSSEWPKINGFAWGDFTLLIGVVTRTPFITGNQGLPTLYQIDGLIQKSRIRFTGPQGCEVFLI